MKATNILRSRRRKCRVGLLSAMLLLALALTGCGQTPSAQQETAGLAAQGRAEPLQTAAVFAMDTAMDLTVYGAPALLERAEAEIAALEQKLSVTLESSEIFAVNQTGTGVLSPDAANLLGRALRLCRRTEGALDVSIYPVVRAWGFTTESYRVPTEEELESLLQTVDYQKVQLDENSGAIRLEPGMNVDCGSIAKGELGDRIMALFRRGGARSAMINLGGNVQVLGSKPDGTPWRIAVQSPRGDGNVGVLEVADKAVITSGGYERYFEKDGAVYWHILDPSTGKPAKNGLVSVTVVGDSGFLCDGLSTALFVMGQEAAVQFWRESDDFEAVFVGEDGSVSVTEGIAESFTLTDGYQNAELTVIRHE